MVGDVGHTGGLTNPRPWHGRCRAGYSNTGGPPLPRKRAPSQKNPLGQKKTTVYRPEHRASGKNTKIQMIHAKPSTTGEIYGPWHQKDGEFVLSSTNFYTRRPKGLLRYKRNSKNIVT